MGNVAFELAEEYAGTVEVADPDSDQEDATKEVDVFQGAVVAVPPDCTSFDVKQELAEGGGLIVVDETNTALVDTLVALPVLKRIAAPAGAQGISAYGTLSAARLREVAKARDLDLGGAKRKEDLIAVLKASDAARLAGDAEAAADPTVPDTEGAPTGQEG